MERAVTGHPITRRAVLASSLGTSLATLPFAARLPGAGEFWNSKPESDWTAEEIAQLTTASPWALTTRVKMSPPPGPPGPDPPDGGFHPRGLSIGPATDAVAAPQPAPSRKNSSAPVAFYGDVTVTWESAAPIRLARKEPLDPEFDARYAVRITGLPPQTFMPETGRIPVIFRLLTGTTLEIASKKHEQAYYVLRLPEKKSLIFAFNRAGFPLVDRAPFVWFTMNLNEMKVRVRFDLRTMTFRNLTAV